MGCINSKTDISEINSNIYRVVNVDANGDELWNGHLEISPKELILYRKGREPTKWSLQHLRRYGFESDIFTFEAGRRCPTGEGIFAFRCRRAEDLFNVMQNYIQGIAFNDDINQQLSDMTLSPSTTGNNIMGLNGSSNSTLVNRFNRQQTTTAMATSATSNSRSNNSIQNHNSNTAATNYLIPSNRQTTSQNSPNGGINFVNVNRRNDTFSNDSGSSNYLEPTPMRSGNNTTTGARYSSGGIRLSSVGSGPISPEPNSPGSPNSFTIILEVTQLNQSQNHHQNYANSNIYHEFPFKSSESNNNNSLNNKLSLDIPPQEPAPAIQMSNPTSNIVMSNSVDDAQQIQGGVVGGGNMPVCSPIENDSSSRMYVNVTPGEMDNIIRNAGTPTTATTKQMNFSFPRLSSTHSIDLSTRCYENLELSESSSVGTKQPNTTTTMTTTNTTTTTRYSKPDIFAKVDLPLIGEHSKTINTTNTGDKSEPTTPVSKEDDRKVNYIVLDLDSSPSSVTSTSTSTVNNISTVTYATVASTKSTSTTGGSAVGLISSNNDSIVSSNNNNDCINNTMGLNNITNSNSNNNNSNICCNQIKSTQSSQSSSSTTTQQQQQQQQHQHHQQQQQSNITNYLQLENSENSTTLGYATIDFNKTVALSNSTLPSVELDNDEGIRKTRHSSTATTRQSNSISD